MLESLDERLMETVHAGTPTKHPAARLATIEAAGELKIPFTTGILVGIGESEESRVESLEALARRRTSATATSQEVILQNFVPHPRYYGAEVAEIADQASKARWGDDGDDSSLATDGEARPGSSPSSESPSMPEWANPVGIEEIKRLIAECKRLMPDVGVQVPPNLSDWWPELVEAGATDLGGLSANGDHISPEEPFPSPHQVRKELAPKGYALTERLCVYPQYMDPEWMEQGVLDVIKLKYWSFIPRRGSGRRQRGELRGRGRRAGDRQGARGTGAERGRADGAVLRDAARGDRGDADRRRRAAGGAGRGQGHLRRQPQHQLHQHLHRRLRLLRVRPGQALAGRLRSLRAGLRGADRGSGRVRRDRALHAGRDPSRPDPGGVRQWLRLAKDVAPQLHLHAYSPMEIDYCCERSGKSRRGGLRVPARVRARLDPGDRGRGARRRGPPADLAEQAARPPAGSRSSKPPTAPACARPRR